jgi:7-cyano-7-deazaguanine synthase in queuosine biosynthesis
MGGGLDSSYLAVNIAKSNTKEQIIGIHFDYGQPASDLEREAVTRIGELIDIEVLYGNFELYDNYIG